MLQILFYGVAWIQPEEIMCLNTADKRLSLSGLIIVAFRHVAVSIYLIILNVCTY